MRMTDTASATSAAGLGSLSLLQLPDEILVLILRRLELANQVNVYETCRHLNALMTAYNTQPQTCRLGHGPHATIESLNLPFFRNFASRVKVLDLSCVPDLSKTKLVPALKRMINLTSLNISRTNLTLHDLLHVYKVCPNLNKICVDVFLSLKKSKVYNMSHAATKEREMQSKTIFEVLQNMEYIHFVGTYYEGPIYHDFLKHIRQHRLKKLKEFQFSCHHVIMIPFLHKLVVFIESTNHKVNKFHYNLMRWNGQFTFSKNWEHIFISDYNKYPKIFLSPKLYNKYQSSGCKLTCDVVAQFDLNFKLKSKWSWYMWRRDIVDYNEDFCDKVIRELENKVAHYICQRTCSGLEQYKQLTSNSYCISTCVFEPECKVEELRSVPPIKKRRSHLEKLWIDLDKFVQADKEFQLTLRRFCACEQVYNGSISFHSRITQMKNMTYLHLDNVVLLDQDFFKCLFQECLKLKTMNINNDELTVLTPTIRLMNNAINLAKSLINLRICESGVINARLYKSLSECKTLQNVHISDLADCATDVSTACLVDFVRTCIRLYSFNLFANFNSNAQARKKQQQLIQAVRGRNIYIKLHHHNVGYSPKDECNLDPYIDVFFSDSVYRSLNVDIKFPPDEPEQ